MTPETALAVEAGLCMEDYRIRQSLLASGLPWTLEAYAQTRWGKPLGELNPAQRVDAPPDLREEPGDASTTAALKEVDGYISNAFAYENDGLCAKYGLDPPAASDEETDYLYEELRRERFKVHLRAR